MQPTTLFLLIGYISISSVSNQHLYFCFVFIYYKFIKYDFQADPEQVKQIKEYVKWFAKYGEGNPIESNYHQLVLLDGGFLGSTENAVVWKGKEIEI